MKVGMIVESNMKGQIVIPKKIRDELNITENTPLNMRVIDDGIYIYPIKEVITTAQEDKNYRMLLRILKETQGAWADDRDFDKRQSKMRKIEIEVAKKMKKAW